MHLIAQLSNHRAWVNHASWMNFPSGIFWYWSIFMTRIAKVHCIPSTLMSWQTCLLGYPPPDNKVCDFLSRIVPKENYLDKSYQRALSFLHALISITTKTISDIHDTPNTPDLAEKFREYMSEGQSMSSSGPNRSGFYERVIQEAAKVCHASWCFFILSKPLSIF